MSKELDKDPHADMVFDDAPRDLRPDMSQYGLEEIDRGVVEDSYENRSVLRAHRLNWQIIYSETGEPTGNILVLSPEMDSRRSERAAEDRRLILTDERDLNSDYLTEEALLIEEASDTLAPLWVTAATRTWLRVKEARKNGEPNKFPMLAGPPVRCRQIKSDGMRCLLWSANRKTDDGLCRVHLGSRHNNITGAVAQARNRAYQAAPVAIEMLEQLMESAESEPVKLKAATEILDRAGIRGGVEIDAKVDVNVQPAADIIMQRLERLRPQAQEIIEVEVLEVESASAEEVPLNNTEPQDD